jgi:CBS domain
MEVWIVRDIVLRSVPTVTVETSLREVAEIMAEHAGSAVLVVDEEGKVLGVITKPFWRARSAGSSRRANWREPLAAVQVSITGRVVPSVGSIGAATDGSSTPRPPLRNVIGRSSDGKIVDISNLLRWAEPTAGPGARWVQAT